VFRYPDDLAEAITSTPTGIRMKPSGITRRAGLVAMSAWPLAATSPLAFAQSGDAYPNRAVELVVPFGAGGGTDVLARVFAEAAKKHFSQPFTVFNRPGASGAIGLGEVAQSKPDGYKNLAEQTPHDGGKRLQLYIYALAGRDRFPNASAVTAYYWFTNADRLIGYPVTELVEQEVSSAIHTIVDGIEAGVFPADGMRRPSKWTSSRQPKFWPGPRRQPALVGSATSSSARSPDGLRARSSRVAAPGC
jgi:hypothetical protein